MRDVWVTFMMAFMFVWFVGVLGYAIRLIERRSEPSSFEFYLAGVFAVAQAWQGDRVTLGFTLGFVALMVWAKLS